LAHLFLDFHDSEFRDVKISHLLKPNGDINIYYHAILGKPRRAKERHRLTQAALHGAVSLGIHRAGGLVPLKYKKMYLISISLILLVWLLLLLVLYLVLLIYLIYTNNQYIIDIDISDY